MNKIFKIIRKGLFGRTVAVSEHTKGQSKSKSDSGLSMLEVHQHHGQRASQTVSHIATPLRIAMSALLLTALGSTAQAGETITYDNHPLKLATDPIFNSSSLFPVSSLRDNHVTVISGTIPGFVYGGVTNGNSEVSGNSVTITGGKVGFVVIGGHSVSGDVIGNSVAITGGEVSWHVAGGYSDSGNATGNSVTISGGEVKNVYGSSSSIGNATGNSVIISGGEVIWDVFGGFTSGFGSASGNSVAIAGGTVGGSVNGGYSDSGNATSNRVTLSGGEVCVGIFGGYSASGNATGNSVAITGGEVLWDVFGGFTSGSGSASGNSVVIGGGTVGEHVFGGFASGSGNASGNSVAIAGGTVGGIVTGGVSYSGSATNNSVNISGTPQFSATGTSLYGADGSGDVFTGNTLEFSAHPITAKNVANFERYRFTIDPAHANKPITLITADRITLGNGSGTPSTIAVVGIHSGNALNINDKFILMKATSLAGDSVGLSTTGIAQQGISLIYNVRTDIDMAGNQVTATITAARVNPQLKALSEGYLAGAMLVTRGADAIAYDTFSAISSQNQQAGFAPFVQFGGSHTRYNSGSHVKSNDFLLTGGISYQHNQLTAGAFLEGGWGNYDTYNSFYNAANVKGDGNSRYFGAGLLGRYDFENGFYADASLRFGRNRNKFDSDIQNIATGQFANYTVTSSYVSAHIGAGYVLFLNDKNELNLSAKYLYTTLGGKNVNVAGDHIQFDRVNSHRARINATLNHQYSPSLTFNAGLGYEHEFDGKADATTYGVYNIDAASVKGGTGILSLGATVKPTTNQNLTLSFKANGYTGKREGVGASIKVNYAF